MFGSRFGMNEEDRRPPRAFPRSLVDDLKSACLHGFECLLRALNAESHVGQPAAATISLDKFLHWRIRGQRFKQLNQIWTFANLQQHFAHLVASQHLLAMNLVEAQHFVRLHRSEEHTSEL